MWRSGVSGLNAGGIIVRKEGRENGRRRQYYIQHTTSTVFTHLDEPLAKPRLAASSAFLGPLVATWENMTRRVLVEVKCNVMINIVAHLLAHPN
jgi:hypothetical protein